MIFVLSSWFLVLGSSMTFKQQRAENFLRVFLNTDQFAETCRYKPYGNRPELDLVAIIQPADEREDEGNQELRKMETITVRFARDPAAAVDGRALGGVACPQVRDQLIRTELDEMPYVYDSPVSSNAYSHLVKFTRPRVDQIGTGHLQPK